MGAIFALLAQLIQIYTIVIFVRIIITWIPNIDPYAQWVQILHQITEPVLEPARRLIPPLGMIDISPIVVFIALQILGGLFMDLSRM